MIRALKTLSSPKHTVLNCVAGFSAKDEAQLVERLNSFLNELVGLIRTSEPHLSDCAIWACIDRSGMTAAEQSGTFTLSTIDVRADLMRVGATPLIHSIGLTITIFKPNKWPLLNPSRDKFRQWLVGSFLNHWKSATQESEHGVVRRAWQRTRVWIYNSPSPLFTCTPDGGVKQVFEPLPEPEQQYVDPHLLVP